MKFRIIALILMALTATAPAAAQEGEGLERIALRVSRVESSTRVVVDRGETDGLKKGDRVLFYPSQGGTYRGFVVEISERNSVVDVFDDSFIPELGTRGEVQVPKSRFAGQEVPPPPVVPPPTEAPVEAPTGQEPVGADQEGAPAGEVEWEYTEDEWTAEMPLLALVRPVNPEDRDTSLSGRVFIIGDLRKTSGQGFKNSIFRAGTDLLYDNPFGKGGGARFSGEFNYLTEVNGEEGWDLLVDRASYFSGGTRFDSTRWEAGRFLQYGMPEFGILDGIEWTKRNDNGDTWGASAGYMPVLDDDFESFDDFQLAAYYNWIANDAETLNISAGYQKTWHHTDADRDLFVAKLRYLPLDGWNFITTAWLDFYTSGDDAKDNGLELTYGLASLSKRWETGNWIDLTYQHQKFAFTDRVTFVPGVPANLANHYADRIILSGSRWLTEEQRLHGAAGGWIDQDQTGGNVEFGLDYASLLFDETNTDVTLFASEGKFSFSWGVRLQVSKYTDDGFWDVFYEWADHQQDDFSANIDDLLQHRLRVNRTWYSLMGWDFSLFGELGLYDQDGFWSVGVYLQKIL